MRSKLLSTFTLLALVSLTAVQAATITVGPSGCDYISVRKAVEEANAGDVIAVQSGTYRENVVVEKQLTLRGENAGDGLPIIDAGGMGSAVKLAANGTELQGFVVTNSGTGKAGIEVRSCNNVIKNNQVVVNKWYGVYVENANGNLISGNNISNNKYGIWIAFSCSDNEIYKNKFLNNENQNAIDAGVNRWDGNLYDDFDKSLLTYEVPGGSNVDENPRAPEPDPTLPTETPSTITVRITIPAPIVQLVMLVVGI